MHQVTDKLYHIMLICIDYTSPKWNSNSQRLCKQRFKTWDLQRWPYWYLVFIITLMPNRNSIYYVIVIVQSIRYMLVILPSLGDPTWAELRRSSGQGSPKLCSITEHIPIRLDNKCFNTWHHQSFPAKKNHLVTLAGLLANCKHGRFSGRNFRGWRDWLNILKILVWALKIWETKGLLAIIRLKIAHLISIRKISSDWLNIFQI